MITNQRQKSFAQELHGRPDGKQINPGKYRYDYKSEKDPRTILIKAIIKARKPFKLIKQKMRSVKRRERYKIKNK